MKRALGVGGLLFFIVSCYAAADDSDPCANNNPYLRQTCETLRQSSQNSDTERNKAYENEMNKSREATDKLLNSEQAKEAAASAPPPPPLPPWQKALKPEAPPQNQAQNQGNLAAQTPSENPSTEIKITPLPAPGATTFANPAPVTLPGGVSIVPTKPSKSNSVKYY